MIVCVSVCVRVQIYILYSIHTAYCLSRTWQRRSCGFSCWFVRHSILSWASFNFPGNVSDSSRIFVFWFARHWLDWTVIDQKEWLHEAEDERQIKTSSLAMQVSPRAHQERPFPILEATGRHESVQTRLNHCKLSSTWDMSIVHQPDQLSNDFHKMSNFHGSPYQDENMFYIPVSHLSFMRHFIWLVNFHYCCLPKNVFYGFLPRSRGSTESL